MRAGKGKCTVAQWLEDNGAKLKVQPRTLTPFLVLIPYFKPVICLAFSNLSDLASQAERKTSLRALGLLARERRDEAELAALLEKVPTPRALVSPQVSRPKGSTTYLLQMYICWFICGNR